MSRHNKFSFAKTLFAFSLIPLFTFSALPPVIFAADIASIQLAVASPDPIQSGGEITFQVILANTGTETWESGRYFFEVQIYDSNKNYLAKTSRALGQKDVPPGETALAYIPFPVPESYAGPYYYRVFMSNKEQRIFEGNYTNFSVTPLPPQPPKEKPVSFGGNAILAVRTYSTTQNKDVANFSLNTVGQIQGRSMLINLNTQFTRPQHTKIIQMLLTYYGPYSTMNFGDVQPNFSPLSYANSGARGIWFQMPLKHFSTEIIGAQAVFKVTGSSNPARTGTFARYVIGGQEKVELPKNFSFAADYVTMFDDKNSLSADPKDEDFRGPDPKEVKNNVMSGTLGWKGFSEKLTIEAQMAQSQYRENTLSDITQTISAQGQAMRLGFNYKGYRFTGKLGIQRTDPDFRALAAPSATSDRQTIDAMAGYNIPIKKTTTLGFNVTGNQFTDNIKNDPKKLTTTQTSMLVGSSLNNPKPWPNFSLFISLNQGQDKTKTALDNQTQTVGINLNQPIGGKTNVSLGVQQSQFKDNLKKSADITTQSQNFSLTSSIGPKLNVSLGGSISKNDSQATPTAPAGSLTSNSYSASVNWTVIRERLVAQFWTTLSNRSGTSSGLKQDVKDQSTNLEFTYQLTRSFALTAGGAKNKTDDSVTPLNNVDETVMSGRITWTF